jgi:endonuclease-3
VSLYNNKAKHIKRTTDILAEKYNHDTPKTYEEVINLPGVGPKMGLLFMRLVTYI